MKKTLLATTMLVALGACSTQSPAPVVSGLFGDGYRVLKEPTAAQQRTVANVNPVAMPSVEVSEVQTENANAYRVANIQEIEPAAGPMGGLQEETLPKKEYGTYRMTRDRDYNSASNAVANASAAVDNLNNPQRMASIFEMKPAAGPEITPVAKPIKPQVTAPKTPTVEMTSYTVAKGDTLYSLSRRFGTTVGHMMEMNDFTSPQQLTAGAQIMVPTGVMDSTTAIKTAAITKSNINTIEPAAGTTSAKSFNNGDVTMVSHKVAKGENLYRIGLKYNVSVIDLMSANEFVVPQDLKAGMTINVPLASTQAATVKTSTDINQAAARAKGMVWPAKGPLLSSFGEKGNGVTHTGIAIKLPENTPIMAAEAGEVIYADDGLKSYGNLVLIRHSDGLVTAYAHNNTLKVKKGDNVKKGQTIALSGATGNVTTPQLHFEVRRNARAIDPKGILPKS